MTTKRWILIFLALALVCGGFLVFQLTADHGSVVTISRDGEILYTIDLAEVDVPYTLTIPYGGHYNVLTVSPDTIQVTEADCSSQVCVNHGPLLQAGAPITCLPHHLIISWVDGEVDA